MALARNVVGELAPRFQEGEDAYAIRARAFLPNWPKDVLIQWPYRHHRAFAAFADVLPLDAFRFRLDTWKAPNLPRSEVYLDPDDYEALTECARTGAVDRLPAFQWVWGYMNENGRWPHPIVVMDCERCERFLIPHSGKVFVKSRRPLTLLEGHCRLAFAHVLRKQGKLVENLPVWIVDVA